MAQWLIAGAARGFWRSVRVYQRGETVEATVTSVHETTLSVNRRIQWAIDFTFRAARHSAPLPYSEAEKWTEGDKGVIRYDPADPSVSVWIGR